MDNLKPEEICQTTYKKTIERLNETLFENLVLADGDDQLEKQARERYKKGLQLAKKFLKICLEEAQT